MTYSPSNEMREHLSRKTKEWFEANPHMKNVRGETMRAARRSSIPKECPFCMEIFESYQNRDASCNGCKPIQRFDYLLRRLYGLDFGFFEYQELFLSQNAACAICLTPQPGVTLHVDHCHETLRVRGLLCGECNLGVGKFKNNPLNLQRASEYLIGSTQQQQQLTDTTTEGI